ALDNEIPGLKLKNPATFRICRSEKNFHFIFHHCHQCIHHLRHQNPLQNTSHSIQNILLSSVVNANMLWYLENQLKNIFKDSIKQFLYKFERRLLLIVKHSHYSLLLKLSLLD